MPLSPPRSHAAERLLRKLLQASGGAARASLGAALGVSLFCAAPAAAQGPRSVLGLAPCPPPPGESRCHPGGNARLLWIYDSGSVNESGWSIDGYFVQFNDHARLVSPKNPQIVQVEIVYPPDAPVCPAAWSTQQPPCHPRCQLSSEGDLRCDEHLVQFLPPSEPAYRQLSPCPPPPGESRCAIRGLPGWIEVHSAPTPSGFERGRGLPSGRFGAGPIWSRAPGASGRELTGSLELSAGYILHLRSRSNDGLLLRFPIELGYAHDWGGSYGGHAFLAGLGAGVAFGDKRAHAFSYVPHLSLGSRGGFSPGIRHGLRYTLLFAVNVELQHQYLSTPAGGSNHVGVLVGLDPVAFGAVLAASVSGRPLLVEGGCQTAPLDASSAWA